MKCVAAIALAVALQAQEPRFDAEARLVVVAVSVTDAKGRAVNGLDASDFVVLDNGRAQRAAVDTIDTGVAPIALVVAVQASGISSAALEKIQKIGSMIQPLITGERGCGALVAFAGEVEWIQECTSDPGLLSNAFRQLRPREEKSGRMLDAVQEGIDRLKARPKVRRVLLLISESRDRGSTAELEHVALAAQKAGIAVYAVTYSAFATGLIARPGESHSPYPADDTRIPSRQQEKIPTKFDPQIPPPEQRVDILGAIGELARLGKVNTTEVLTKATGGETLSFARQKGL